MQALRVLTRRAIDEQPTADPAFDAFGLVADECGLTFDQANDVIGGFALDATRWQPRTEADMMRYCYHVAGAVGIMMARIMGVPEEDGEMLDRACDLGHAFQLANIARDIVEDAEAGRCYLPRIWLEEMGWEAGEHAAPENRFKLARLMPRMIALMEKHEEAAKFGTKKLHFRQRWAVLAAARIYGAIGRKVLARGQLAWNRRVRVSAPEKAWHIVASFFEAVINRPAEPREPILWSRHDFRPVAGW